MLLDKVISLTNIRPQLKATDKAGVLEELVDILMASGSIKDRDAILEAVWKREKLMSTGLHDGIATPHAKTDLVSSIIMSVGLIPDGIDFEALDGNPSRIFILLLSPSSAKGPHVECLAEIAKRLKEPEARERLLTSTTMGEIHKFFTE